MGTGLFLFSINPKRKSGVTYFLILTNHLKTLLNQTGLQPKRK